MAVSFNVRAQSRPISSTNVPLDRWIAQTDTISPKTLENFINREKIGSIEADALYKFYAERDFKLAWFTKDGLTEHAQSFWNRYKQYLYYSKDSSIYNAKLHKAMDSLMGVIPKKISAYNALELPLTHHFYTFIQRAYVGTIDPVNFNWHIPRKKITPIALLEQLLANTKRSTDWLPVSGQYLKMRSKLMDLQQRQKGRQKTISLTKNELIRLGDSSAAVVAVKKALFRRGDFNSADTSMLYTPEAVAAVEHFQRRHGLGVDGVVGSNVIKAINVPLSERIKQLMINMERLRWLPEPSQATAIWVNIPEYKLYVFHQNEEVLKMDIVVGRSANRTVIFSDKIQHVVFSPYWNVPESIVRNEIVPAINRDAGYLQKNEMEIIGQRSGLPIVRQKPGGQNALGRVKFIFPNQYDIYFHDTPSKYLFERTTRAFSHGCIRLSEPVEFAKYLLKDQPSWTEAEIYKAMHLGKEKWVKLAEPIPVAIGYFTAWIDASGQLNFRDDIYGHDKRMAEQLFEETSR